MTRKNAASLWFYDATRRSYATTEDPRIKFAIVFRSRETVKDLPRLEFRRENFRGKPDKTRGRTTEFIPLRGKSPPEIDAKQNCRTKRCNDCLREKNVKRALDEIV